MQELKEIIGNIVFVLLGLMFAADVIYGIFFGTKTHIPRSKDKPPK